MEIFDILGPHSHPPAPIEVKFCETKRTHVPVSHAKFDVNRCNESPLRGEKPDFWPVIKFNTDSFPRRGYLPVITKIVKLLALILLELVYFFTELLKK